MRTLCCLCFCLSEEREAWIRAKYEQRAFVAALQPALGTQMPEDSMPEWLVSAVSEKDLPRLLLLLAHSTKEQINAQQAGSPSLPRTALHTACQQGDVVMTQLLVWVSYSFTVNSRLHTVHCTDKTILQYDAVKLAVKRQNEVSQ